MKLKYLILSFAFLLTANGVAQNTSKDDSTKYAKNPPEVVIPTKPEAVDTNSVVYQFADVMPEFPGGKDAMKKYFQDSTRYHAVEKDQGKTAVVYVYFVVTENGSITSATVKANKTGVPDLSNEALRLVNAMPKWSPGMNGGKAVKVGMIVQVEFVVPK